MDSARTASFLKLLLQLSEYPPATLSGRAASAHFCRAFDRLLSERMLLEEEPADAWPGCRDCDCAAGMRSIQRLGEHDVAICPVDSRRDVVLGSEDRRLFVIDERRFAMLCLGDDPSVVAELVPGLWARSQKPDDWTLLTFQRSVVEMRELPAVLDATARMGRRMLFAPKPTAEARVRLSGVARLSVGVLKEALQLSDDGRLRLELHRPQDVAVGPRLSVDFRTSAVNVDGCRRSIPPARFKLLRLLVEAWEDGEAVPASIIATEFSGREPKKIVSALRDDLARRLPEEAAIRRWVQTENRPVTAYRLQLPRELVEINR